MFPSVDASSSSVLPCRIALSEFTSNPFACCQVCPHDNFSSDLTRNHPRYKSMKNNVMIQQCPNDTLFSVKKAYSSIFFFLERIFQTISYLVVHIDNPQEYLIQCSGHRSARISIRTFGFPLVVYSSLRVLTRIIHSKESKDLCHLVSAAEQLLYALFLTG